MPKPPSFSAIARADENAFAAQLGIVREALAHQGEKGRALEAATMAILRPYLPAEYGLSTGFVVAPSADGATVMTSQLDIIIYDAVRGGPIVRLGTCDVFAYESALAWIEVKASLRSSKRGSPPADSLERCVKNGTALNRLRSGRFWIPVAGSKVRTRMEQRPWENMRSFIVAFDAKGRIASAQGLANRMQEALVKNGPDAHVHGILVPNMGFFRTRPVDAGGELHHVEYNTSEPLAAFRVELLSALARFPRCPESWVPAIDAYFERKPWAKVPL